MKTLLYIWVLVITTTSFAQTAVTRKAHYNTNSENVMNDGYDPVSYFDGKALKGKKEFSSEYKGVVYWFSSNANRLKFKNNPAKYEAQYGGWCAYAMGLKPEKVKVDPNTYKIVDGKLYLFYNFYLTNTLKSWDKDEANLLSNAPKNWELIIQ